MSNVPEKKARTPGRYLWDNPWSGLMEMQKDMNRLFSDLEFPWNRRTEKDFDWAPSCDAKETDKELALRFDLPGIKKDDIKIEVDGNRLTISGERREEKSEGGGKNHLSEVFYGSFMRTFVMPGKVDPAKVAADYKDGVLTVKVPKTEKPKATTVDIK